MKQYNYQRNQLDVKMIKNILKMINTNDWLVGDEDINIAKGKYEAPVQWKEMKPYLKRNRN